MQTVNLPRIGTAAAWRDAARQLLARGVPPEAVLWEFAEPAQNDLFAGETGSPGGKASPINVPKAFLDLAQTVVWSADPERFARLYGFLWRLRVSPQLMSDRGNPELARLRTMEKNVRRCAHKMKAFVRFRDIGDDVKRRRFAAWFEPTHHTVEPTAPFFASRFADMDWIIATPDVTARFEDGVLTIHEGQHRPDLTEDAAEELWGTYFRNIFNPARLKVSAMTSEMPRKYWKNLPEARHIPNLIAHAEERAHAMQLAAPTLPPLYAQKVMERQAPQTCALPGSLDALSAGLRGCARCPLYRDATQAVPGEGPADARLMIVGEQPGDTEDMHGRPFVGPAGQLFDQVATEAGLDRRSAYVTNAVKHFKFKRTGKRRLHIPPNRTEIEHCKWWLQAEIALVKPELIVAMGATALQSLTGRREGLMKRCGRVEKTAFGPVFVTVHPSYLLRLPTAELRAAETEKFRDDLARVGAVLSGQMRSSG